MTRGGTLKIRTTSRARTCRLTVHIGSVDYRRKINGRRGRDFTIPIDAQIGIGQVTVRCGGRSQSTRFTIISSAQPPVTPTPSSSPPAATPPPGTTPPPAPKTTGITVSDVCTLSPTLGPYVYVASTFDGRPAPTAAWLNQAGRIRFFASSLDGDNVADVAVVPNADTSAVLWYARCDWPAWINAPEWQQQTPGVPADQNPTLAFMWQFANVGFGDVGVPSYGQTVLSQGDMPVTV